MFFQNGKFKYCRYLWLNNANELFIVSVDHQAQYLRG